ncbi:MAG: hypothetical protein JO165_01260 [Candidatus Eremiobacteraeota bacterium]|nr:hypothetical protein [Candidatus Eremiobacteraeota bacterium]
MKPVRGYYLCAGLLTGISITTLAFASGGRALSAAFAIVTCGSTTACSGGSNTSTGPGVSGVSAKGKGVVGQAKFNSTSVSNAQSGVLGQDLSTSGAFNSGVSGSSTRGTGVAGTSSSGIGIVATSASTYAFKANAPKNYGVYATGYGGVYGVASGSEGAGAYAYGTGTGSVGVYGQADDGYAGFFEATQGALYARAGGGNGVEAHSDTGDGVYAVSNALDTIGAAGWFYDPGTAVVAQGGALGALAISNTGTSNYPILAQDASGNMLFYVDGDGNVGYHGSLTTFARVRGGATIQSYATSNTAPRIQDSGSAELSSGVATVRLNSAFSAAIDTSAPYQVILTPGADTRGLYVASKSPRQFVVRELQGGRSSLPFDYEIIARQAGHASDNIAMLPAGASVRRAVVVHHPRRHVSIARPLLLRPHR